METNTMAAQVQKLIAAGNIEPAIQLLLAEFEEKNPKAYQQTLLLSNKYASLQQEKRLGLSPSHNENEIVLALIELATQKSSFAANKFTDTPSTKSKTSSLLLIGAVVLFVTVTSLLLFNRFKSAKNDVPTNEEPNKTEQSLANQVMKTCSDHNNILIFSSIPTNNNDNATPRTQEILTLLQQQQCNANLGTHYIDAPQIAISEIKYFDVKYQEKAALLSQYIQEELGLSFKTLYVPFKKEWVGNPSDINICFFE